MLDASKAFDKMHFGKPFNLMIDRKLPAIVICLSYLTKYVYNL